MTTRILFVDGTYEICDYARSAHMPNLRKFLGWNMDLLIVGGHDTHRELYKAYCQLSGEQLGIPTLAGDLSPVSHRDILFVVSWCSFHFDIRTPREMEDIVLGLLGARQLD